MAPTEITAPAHTGDLGLAIADFIDGRQFELYRHDDPEMPGRDEFAKVDAVDRSDKNNLIVVLDNGQAFTVRIIAGART